MVAVSAIVESFTVAGVEPAVLDTKKYSKSWHIMKLLVNLLKTQFLTQRQTLY